MLHQLSIVKKTSYLPIANLKFAHMLAEYMDQLGKKRGDICNNLRYVIAKKWKKRIEKEIYKEI